MRPAPAAWLLFLAIPAAAGGSVPASAPPGAMPPEIRTALALAEDGRKREALGRVDRYVAAHPADVGARVVRGDLRFDCLDAPAAIEDYRFVLGARPGDPYVTGRLFEALMFSLRYREALDLLDRLVTRDPADPALRRTLVRVRARERLLGELGRRRRRFRLLAGLAAAAWIAALGLALRRLAREPRPSRD